MPRPAKPETIQDAQAAQDMRPMDGPDGRSEHATKAGEHAQLVAQAYNDHFRKDDWMVLTMLASVHAAILDSGARAARLHSGPYAIEEVVRAYVPSLAPMPNGAAQVSLAQAFLIGRHLSDLANHSYSPLFQSASRPGFNFVGVSGEKPVYTTLHARDEMEAQMTFLTRSNEAWISDASSVHPRWDAAMQRVAAIRAEHSRIETGLGWYQDEAIAIFGEAVGTCPDAEQAALRLIWYSQRRFEAAAPMNTPQLILCSAVDCRSPLFVWEKEQETRTSRRPSYCPSCGGCIQGDTDRTTALRVNRLRRRRSRLR